VIIPAPVQALPSEGMRHMASQEFELADLDYPIERIVNLAVRNEIPYLNLVADLREYADSNGAYLYGFSPQLGSGHLNAIGNEVSGRSIAKWLCSGFGGRDLH
jgi:hypothetical protein